MVAALEREIAPLIKDWTRIEREHEGREFTFFEQGRHRRGVWRHRYAIGPARCRRSDRVIPSGAVALGRLRRSPEQILYVGDIFSPGAVIDARDGSRIDTDSGRRDAPDLHGRCRRGAKEQSWRRLTQPPP